MTIAAVVGIAGLLDITVKANGEEANLELIERIIAEATKSGVALRATRELRAGTQSGNHVGWMQVETVTSSTGAFTWTVLDEGGSARTRNKVFRELLDAEAQAAQSTRDETGVTRENYTFGAATRTPEGQLELRLIPRRQDPRLIDGTITVSADGSPVLLQGRLAKSPSFWVKSVTVVKRFIKLDGVTVPTTIESLADLKMFGEANFSMRYRYSEVNGRPVTHAGAELPPFGPALQRIAQRGPGAQ